MASAEQRLKAALQLIRHNPSRGTLGEQAIREVIDAFLPGQWTSSSGFVLHHETGAPSRQVDVLIYDRLAGTPIYSDESVVVLPTARPGLAVEVKSELKKKSFAESLVNVASFKQAYGGRSGISASIYAFRGFSNPQKLKQHLETHMLAFPDWNLWLNVICIQSTKMLVTLTYDGNVASLVCRRCLEPVIQSLLTSVLNALGVPGTKEFLPEPRMGEELFTLKRGEL